MPLDNSLDSYVAERFQNVFRVPYPRWMSWLMSFSLLRKLFFQVSQFPDRAVYLNRASTKKISELNLEDYEVLVTWSQFHSAHLAGLELKRKAPYLKWFAHFSDPWVDNPYNRWTFLTTPFFGKWEKAVMELCDHVSFTTEQTRTLVMKKYGPLHLKKTSVIPHSFDLALYGDEIPRKDGKLIFRYLGYFYGKRTPLSLLAALVLLKERRPELLERICFEFVGGWKMSRVEKRVLAGVEKNLPRGVVKFLPSVDYISSLRLMKSSNGLLVIDAPAELSVFLPSKLVDYLGSGNPIIGMTPPGASREVIERHGGWCASPSDPIEISRVLERAIDRISAGWQSRPPEMAYHSQTVSHQLESVLANI